MNGTLIVIDGLDGSGKQTQARLLRERLERERVPVRAISFPDYGQPSSALVRLYLDGRFGQADEVSAYAASSFYAVDRFASYMQFWKDDYLSGHTILADRYTTSNLIHQMSKLPREEWGRFIAWLEAYEYDEMCFIWTCIRTFHASCFRCATGGMNGKRTSTRPISPISSGAGAVRSMPRNGLAGG